MMLQTMMELVNPFDCHVRLMGEGTAMFMIAGSNTSNPQFMVRLYETGMMRTVDQNDIIIWGNPAFETHKIVIPESWKRKQSSLSPVQSAAS